MILRKVSISHSRRKKKKEDTDEALPDLRCFAGHKITTCHLPFAGHFYHVAGQNEI